MEVRKYILSGLCSMLGLSAVKAQQSDFRVFCDTLDNGTLFAMAYAADEDTSATSFVRTYRIEGRQVRVPQADIPQLNLQVTVENREQFILRDIQSKRVAFFTDAMSLTPEEAQVFWPLFNQLQEKRNKLQEAKKHLMKRCSEQRIANMPPAEAGILSDRLINLQQQETDLLVEYHKKFKAILSSKKVLQMYKADKDFTLILLQSLRGGGGPSDM